MSLFGMGAPYYLRVGFLPTERCNSFMDSIKTAISQRAISRFAMSDKYDEIAAEYYRSSMLIIDYMMRKNGLSQNRISGDVLEYLSRLEASHSRQRGTVEFK